MKAVTAIVRRELLAYFYSPLGYVVSASFLLVFGFLFHGILLRLSDPRAPAEDVFPLLFSTYFSWIVVLLYCSAITMRLLAEERRTGSLESLMTSPVRAGQVVFGKFCGAFLYYVFLWLPTLVWVGILARNTRIDPGPIAAGYVGLLLVGALFLAIGIFASTLTRNQVVAALLGAAICLLLFLSGVFLERMVSDPAWKDLLSQFNMWDHLIDFGRGIVDTRRVVFYLSGTGFFLWLAAGVLELGRWR